MDTFKRRLNEHLYWRFVRGRAGDTCLAIVVTHLQICKCHAKVKWLLTPVRTHSISGLKSRVMKLPFLSLKMMVKSGLEFTLKFTKPLQRYLLKQGVYFIIVLWADYLEESAQVNRFQWTPWCTVVGLWGQYHKKSYQNLTPVVIFILWENF